MPQADVHQALAQILAGGPMPSTEARRRLCAAGFSRAEVSAAGLGPAILRTRPPIGCGVWALKPAGAAQGGAAVPKPAAARARNGPAPAAEVALAELLGTGSMGSQEATGALLAMGFTPKQIRRAREQLGVVVTRTGRRSEARSTWAMPAGAGVAEDGLADRYARRARVREGPAGSAADDGASLADRGPFRARVREPQVVPAEPSLLELERRDHRVVVFVRHGIPQDEAIATADALLLADRQGREAFGSCAQCQLMWWRECPDVRPSTHLHQCSRRRSGV